MQINCIIVDDDPIAAQVLVKCIRRVPFLRLLKVCTSAPEAESYLCKNEVGLLYLDIVMPGMDGISLMRKLQNTFQVIFTTSKEEYAVAAFDLNALDYIVKPVSFSRFLRATAKAREKLGFLGLTAFTQANVVVETLSGTLHLHPGEIAYIERKGPGVHVYTSRYTSPVIAVTGFEELENSLQEGRFVKINHETLINVDKISSLGFDWIVVKGERIYVDPAYRQQLRKIITI
jgi:two-component system, LytTR family, response regulator